MHCISYKSDQALNLIKGKYEYLVKCNDANVSFLDFSDTPGLIDVKSNKNDSFEEKKRKTPYSPVFADHGMYIDWRYAHTSDTWYQESITPQECATSIHGICSAKFLDYVIVGAACDRARLKSTLKPNGTRPKTKERFGDEV